MKKYSSHSRKGLEKKIWNVDKKLDKTLSKGKIRKVRKYMVEYNGLLDCLWSEGPSSTPLRRIKSLDENKQVLQDDLNI